MLQEIDPEGIYKNIRHLMEQMPDELRTDEALYQKRLAACAVCEQLHDGVCGLCGCFVELRAAKRLLSCPQGDAAWALRSERDL